MSYPDQDPLPGLGPQPPRPRAPRPVIAGLLVAAISAAAGAAIAHEAWSGGGSSPTPVSQPSGSAATTSVSAVARKVDPGIVDINTTLAGPLGGAAAGTGMVVTSSGEVLTNNHVISQAGRITAYDVGNGRTYSARVVGYSTRKDVAVLQLLGASGLETVSFGDSNTVKVGQSVVTIGNAGGVGGTPSAAGGSVTALGRSITAQDDSAQTYERLTGLIELDGQLQPGDSGGPLVNSAGQVIGMDTAASSSFSFQSSGGQGFAIPVNTALAFARQIVAGKGSDSVHVGATGLIGIDIEPQNNFGYGAPQGVYVGQVVTGGPAAAAGIVGGDTITALGGHRVTSASSLVATKDLYHPGNRVSVTWVDINGASHTGTITLSTGAPD